MELVLDDNALIGLSQRSDIIAAFPTIKLAAPVVSVPFTRTCCAGKKNIRNVSTRVYLVKLALMGLSEEKKKQLKAILQASKITFYVNLPGKGVQTQVI